jgi:hypothetical protein
MSSYLEKKIEHDLENVQAKYGNILQQPQFQQHLNEGNPMNVPKNQNIYEQAIKVKKGVKEAKYKYFKKLFKKKFPRQTAFIQAAVMIFISLLGIVLQTVLIVKKTPLSFIGGGIWAGAYGFLFAGLILATGKNHLNLNSFFNLSKYSSRLLLFLSVYS